MANCIFVRGDGTIYATYDAPDRQGCYDIADGLAWDAYQYVIVVATPEDVAAVGGGASSPTPDPSPLNLTAEQGVVVSMAIVSTWLVGWAFKAFIRVLNGTES